jgi:hypothetical protein
VTGVDPARFAAKVSPFTEGPLECRPWLGALSDGRAIVHDPVLGQPVQASHVAWELEHGLPVPPGLVVLHVCNHPWCVRADAHLVVGPQAANLAHMALLGRSAVGRGPGGGRGGRSRRGPDAASAQAEALAIRARHLRLVEMQPQPLF